LAIGWGPIPLPCERKRSFKTIEELLEDGLLLGKELQARLPQKPSGRLQPTGGRARSGSLAQPADDQPQPLGRLCPEVRIILRSRSSRRSELFCDLGEVDFEIVNEDGLHEHPTSTMHAD
jgi:hypothetical protein